LLEDILVSVIVSVFDFLKIHGEVILGDATIVVEDMLGVTPESLDAVDVILGSSIHKLLAVTDHMMLAITSQGLVTPKGVGVIDRAFSRSGLDVAVRQRILVENPERLYRF
jgi:hypothetical protein